VEKLRCDTLDALFKVLALLAESTDVPLQLFKADVDAAFRRIPIAPGHRQFGGVAFVKGGTIFGAKHLSMPFGSVASVHNWDRVGSMLCTFARRLLHIPCLRYVDDYFGPDWAGEAGAAKDCLARCVLFPPYPFLCVQLSVYGTG